MMFWRYLTLAILVALPAAMSVPVFSQAAAEPPEAKLEKFPSGVRLDKGEERCGDYFIFRLGTGDVSEQSKISYFEQKPGVPPVRFRMHPLHKVEVSVDPSKPTPTAQTFEKEGAPVKVVLRMTDAELQRSACLKDRAEKAK